MSSIINDPSELILTPQQLIKKARATYPAAYALSVNEAMRVQRFDDLVWQFFDTHPEFRRVERLGEDDNTHPKIVNVYDDKSIDLLKRFFTVKRLSLANAYALALRVLSNPWFEVLSVFNYADTTKHQAALNTSEGYKGIIDEANEAFYTLWLNNRDESNAHLIRDALKLNDSYLYLCAGERDILQLIKLISEYNTPFTTTQEEGFVAIKSIPQSTALIGVGKKSIEQAKYDKLNEFLDVISTTGEHIYIRGKQLHPSNGSEFVNLDKMNRQIIAMLHKNGYSSKMITLSLDDYMAFRDVHNRKDARKQFEKDLSLLYEVSLNYNGIESRYLQTRAKIQNSKVLLILTDLYFESLRANNSIAYIPQEFFSLKGNAYKIAIFLADNHKRNIGKRNENRVSIAKLLEATSLNLVEKIDPKYYKRQIIDPFFNALSKAAAKGFSYSIVHHGGAPLNQLEQFEIHHNYLLFISCLVEVTWDKEPEHYKTLRENKSSEAAARKRGRLKMIEAQAKSNKPIKKDS